MSTDLKAPPQSWPVLAEDPDGWSLRQGRTYRRNLVNGSSLLIEFVWSTDAGFSAAVEVDGVPYMFGPICNLPAVQLAAEVNAFLAYYWPSFN